MEKFMQNHILKTEFIQALVSVANINREVKISYVYGYVCVQRDRETCLCQ